MFKHHIETLPAHWGSALINGDYSGYTDQDIQDIKQTTNGLPSPVSVDNPYIGRYNGLLCEVADYLFLIKDKTL